MADFPPHVSVAINCDYIFQPARTRRSDEIIYRGATVRAIGVQPYEPDFFGNDGDDRYLVEIATGAKSGVRFLASPDELYRAPN